MAFKKKYFLVLFLQLITAYCTFAQNTLNPVARFSFNNNSNEDEITKHKAKLIGVNFTEDRFGNANNAVFVSGNISSYINLGNYNALKPVRGSISLWIKLESPIWAGRGMHANPILLTKSDTSSDFFEAYSLYYELDTKKTVACFSKDSTNQINNCSINAIVKNKWAHLVITYNNNFSAFYLDGKLQSTFPKNFETHFLSTDSVLIGGTGNKKNERFLKADVDDIEFYDKVLNADEVKTLYNAPNPNRNEALLNLALSCFVFIVFGLLVYFVIKHQVKKGVLKEKQRLELDNKLLETELRVNRASMNPHFLFNSLNALHNFILNNENDNASNYLITFSKLIRKILDSNMHESISLELEIELLDLYMEIENLRFEENIKYTITTEDALTLSAVRIPIMMLQPFIENAIWHGLLNKKGEKIISISFSLHEENYIYCKIEDNGLGRKKISGNIIEKKSLATGFVIQRLELLNKIHNLNCSLVIEDKPNSQGTIIKIILPILN